MAWTNPRTWVTDEVVTAAVMNTHVRDNLSALGPDGATSASWTPSLTGSTSGGTDPADAGREYQIGPLQFAWAYWLSPSIVDPLLVGQVGVVLPASAAGITSSSAGGQVIGSWRYLDSGTPANSESGSVFLSNSNSARFGRPVGATVTNTAPFVAGTGDMFSFYVCYPVA
jgi:hypothetical protein